MRTLKILSVILIAYIISSCNSDKSSKSGEKLTIKKNYNELGILESEISGKDGIKHGPSKYYYENGKIQYLIQYENGKKHGESIWYYKDGSIYQITPFVQGNEHGIRKKYYESGNLMAEIPYHNGIQIPGMKEFKENGNLITDYPEIIFIKPEKVGSDRYFLRMHMSNNTKKVKFQQILVDSSGDTVLSLVPTQDGIGEIPFFVSRGGSTQSTIKIYAEIQTPLRNKYMTEGEYFVNITNK